MLITSHTLAYIHLRGYIRPDLFIANRPVKRNIYEHFYETRRREIRLQI